MCRLLLSLDGITLEKINYFMKQSYKKKFTPLLKSTRDYDLNKDGYGFGWINNENEFEVYKSDKFFLNDNYFNKYIKNIIKHKIIIGHLRAICPKSNETPNIINTHPFKYNENIFVHNGCIEGFDKTKDFIKMFVNIKYHNKIIGNTDSELIFYLFLSFLDKSNITKTIINFFNFLYKINNTISANIIFSNHDYIFISRFINISDGIPPSLYFDENKMIFSSEPITEKYFLIPKNTGYLYNIKNKKLIEIKL